MTDTQDGTVAVSKSEQCQRYAARATELAVEKPWAATHFRGVAAEWREAAQDFQAKGE